MKMISFLLMCLIGFSGYSQNRLLKSTNTGQVEQSFYGLQIGFLGLWVHNETRLTATIALRSEVGLEGGMFGGSIYYDSSKANMILAPILTLAPRWYYNLDKRADEQRKTLHNSGNFIGLELSYLPDWFVVSNLSHVEVKNQILIIPKWGIRRHIGRHFNYELGFGIGFRHTFIKEYTWYYDAEDENSLVLDFHIRLGYTF